MHYANNRDAAFGGIVGVYHMKPTGFEVISEQDCKDLHYMYAAEKSTWTQSFAGCGARR